MGSCLGVGRWRLAGNNQENREQETVRAAEPEAPLDRGGGTGKTGRQTVQGRLGGKEGMISHPSHRL